MTALILATLVSFHFPTTNCNGFGAPELDSMRLWLQPSGATARVAVVGSARGREGSLWQGLVVAPPDTVTAVWVDLTDVSGNHPCAGNVLWLPGTVSVPYTVAAGDTTLYDVQGRRATGSARGIYFGRKRRVVR